MRSGATLLNCVLDIVHDCMNRLEAIKHGWIVNYHQTS